MLIESLAFMNTNAEWEKATRALKARSTPIYECIKTTVDIASTAINAAMMEHAIAKRRRTQNVHWPWKTRLFPKKSRQSVPQDNNFSDGNLGGKLPGRSKNCGKCRHTAHIMQRYTRQSLTIRKYCLRGFVQTPPKSSMSHLFHASQGEPVLESN